MRPNNFQAITIRPYAAADTSILASLFRSSVRDIASRDYTDSQIREWAPDHIDERRFAQKCGSRPTWVAEVHGRIAGFSDLEPDGHVDMLYVHPHFQRRGVARALLEHIEEAARAAGLRRLYTESSITARPVFEATGFRLIGPQTVNIRGVSMTNYRMEKCLESSAADSSRTSSRRTADIEREEFTLHPLIEPYEVGTLDVGDGHILHYEQSGKPCGKPALMLHGGPGSGSTPATRREFDADAWRVVLFDQRGCGRSTPHASIPEADLSTNTTPHLIADIERLRMALGIEKWLVRGASWGSVLALAYAEQHPERVSEMVLSGVGSGRRIETELMTRGLGRLFPEAWARFRDMAPPAERDGDLAAAYNRLLFQPDANVRDQAARAWCEWETAMLPTTRGPHSRYDNPQFRLAFARLVTHYWSNASWLEEGQLLRNAWRLADIPGVIVQGRLDLTNLAGTPWELAAAWPGSRLIIVEETGHEGGTELTRAVVAAIDGYRCPAAGQRSD